jgi:hypothetical protein
VKAELKTKQTAKSVTAFLNAIPDKQRREDCHALLRIMKKATKAAPKMWGPSIVGLGDCHYKYESGRENDWFLMGFSPRRDSLTLYAMGGFPRYVELLKRLGKYKLGKGCLYIKRLSDVDQGVLASLLAAAVTELSRAKA